ncbi:tyrosine-type recombinase/integrase [Schaalia sp. lx-260]|uniref:tyrosine-type recombinase/integrase n=1 Tax=Schaalia sp. lx-260 TaxID=2899082 RepID=UPI001E28EEBD|nr:site-specific integrase [Schaalia sp. lx-260]MCD4549711.1 site-specific integrase [Schaalia sp. lx-260]
MGRRKKYELPHGEGSFYFRSSDKMWIGVLEAGLNSRGKRRRITVSSKDKDRAWEKLTAKRKEIAAGEITPEGLRSNASVESWITEYLHIREQTTRPKTYRGELAGCRQWIIPTLGRRKLKELTPADIRKLTDTIINSNLTTTYATSVQRIFIRALKAAQLEGHSVPDRVLKVPSPGKSASGRTAIPTNDAAKLLQAADTLPNAARWVAALLQGMRQGEVLGLTWDCVNLEAGTIDVSWQLQELSYKDRTRGTFTKPRNYECRQLIGSYHLVRPKTKAGYRIIPLVPWMRNALEALALLPRSPHGLVWFREDNPEMPISSDMDRKAWKALQDRAGVWKSGDKEEHTYYVLHEARHTTATLLLAAGVDPEIIRTIMGHSDIVTTRGYQHASQEMARWALEKVATSLQLGSEPARNKVAALEGLRQQDRHIDEAWTRFQKWL